MDSASEQAPLRKYRIIHLAALDAAKAELYSASQTSGFKKVELARWLAALGKRLAVEVQDAA